MRCACTSKGKKIEKSKINEILTDFTFKLEFWFKIQKKNKKNLIVTVSAVGAKKKIT